MSPHRGGPLVIVVGEDDVTNAGQHALESRGRQVLRINGDHAVVGVDEIGLQRKAVPGHGPLVDAGQDLARRAGEVGAHQCVPVSKR